MQMQVRFEVYIQTRRKGLKYVTDGLPFLLPVCQTRQKAVTRLSVRKIEWMPLSSYSNPPGPFERTIQKHSSYRVMTILFFRECMKHISKMIFLSTHNNLSTVACYQCTKVCLQQRVAPPTKLMIMILFQWLPFGSYPWTRSKTLNIWLIWQSLTQQATFFYWTFTD